MKIWARVRKGEKTLKSYVYEKSERLTYSHFFVYISEICTELDIPTPVLLKSHLLDFGKFRHVRFKQKDFVESIDFDCLTLENIE